MIPEPTVQTAPPAIMTVTTMRIGRVGRSAGPRSSVSIHQGRDLLAIVSSVKSASLPPASRGHAKRLGYVKTRCRASPGST